VAVQHRMAFQGEYFVDRYGQQAAANSPPLRTMLDMGVPVGGGTDATRVASYNPWVSLYWLVTGKTVGGLQLYGEHNRLEREEALRLWTLGSAYKSNEETSKGALAKGMYADLAVLSADFMNVPDEQIKDITAILTVVGGKIVYAADIFKNFDAPLPPASPDWSPVRQFGGYQCEEVNFSAPPAHSCAHHTTPHTHDGKLSRWLGIRESNKPNFDNPWAVGCGCFAY